MIDRQGNQVPSELTTRRVFARQVDIPTASGHLLAGDRHQEPKCLSSTSTANDAAARQPAASADGLLAEWEAMARNGAGPAELAEEAARRLALLQAEAGVPLAELTREIWGCLAAVAERKAKRISGNWRLYYRVEQALAADREPDALLAGLVQMVLPDLADLCAVDVLSGTSGTGKAEPYSRHLALEAKPSLSKREQVAAALEQMPLHPHAPRGPAKVARTGQWDFVPHVTDSDLEDLSRDARHLCLMRQLRPKSYICVPLRHERSAVGALPFMSWDHTRRYTPEDLEVAEAIGRVCGEPASRLVNCRGSGSVCSTGELHPETSPITPTRVSSGGADLASAPIAPAGQLLTHRQRQLLHLVEEGLTNPEIARRLCLARNTVKSYLQESYAQLGVNTRLQAVREARRLGLL